MDELLNLIDEVGVHAEGEWSEASDEDLGRLEGALLEAVDAAVSGEVDADGVALLQKAADAAESIRDEAGRRMVLAEEVAGHVEEALARLRPVEDEPEVTEDESETETAEVEVEADAPEAEAEAETDEPEREAATTEEEPVLETVEVERTEAPPAPAKAAAARRPARTRPRRSKSRVRILDLSSGRELASMKEAGEALFQRAEQLGKVRAGYAEDVPVIRLDYRDAFPSDQTLSDDQHSNMVKVEEFLGRPGKAGSVTDPDRWDDSLVASGGFCAPSEISYDIAQISGAQRPVRDGMPTFRANRGGLQTATPPTLAQVDLAGADAAITVHSNADDVAGSSKGVQVPDCVEFVETRTQAIVKRLQFGNFADRAFPEFVETWDDLAMAAHARVAEQELLDAVVANSTAVTTTQQLGAAREVLRVVIQAATGYRNRHRMPPTTRLRALMPAWVLDAMASDVTQQQASGELDALAVARADASAWLARHNVNVTFYEDTPTGLGQVFAAQAAGALNPFPDTVHWFLFHEGGYTYLDGGTLDLGIVRDSTLNATNDLQTFVETFEGLAPRAVESLWIASPICVNGESQIAVDASTCVGS